jgi:hypothetical protein
MFNPCVAAALKEIDKTDQIGVHIGVGVDQGIAHPGLGRQIDHRVELFLGKQGCGPFPIGHVESGMAKGGMGQQLSQTIPLELRIIVVVQIVEPNDLSGLRPVSAAPNRGR